MPIEGAIHLRSHSIPLIIFLTGESEEYLNTIWYALMRLPKCQMCSLLLLRDDTALLNMFLQNMSEGDIFLIHQSNHI